MLNAGEILESELLIYFALNISQTKGSVVIKLPEHLQTRILIMSTSDSFLLAILPYDMEFIFYMWLYKHISKDEEVHTSTI